MRCFFLLLIAVSGLTSFGADAFRTERKLERGGAQVAADHKEPLIAVSGLKSLGADAFRTERELERGGAQVASDHKVARSPWIGGSARPAPLGSPLASPAEEDEADSVEGAATWRGEVAKAARADRRLGRVRRYIDGQSLAQAASADAGKPSKRKGATGARSLTEDRELLRIFGVKPADLISLRCRSSGLAFVFTGLERELEFAGDGIDDIKSQVCKSYPKHRQKNIAFLTEMFTHSLFKVILGAAFMSVPAPRGDTGCVLESAITGADAYSQCSHRGNEVRVRFGGTSKGDSARQSFNVTYRFGAASPANAKEAPCSCAETWWVLMQTAWGLLFTFGESATHLSTSFAVSIEMYEGLAGVVPKVDSSMESVQFGLKHVGACFRQGLYGQVQDVVVAISAESFKDELLGANEFFGFVVTPANVLAKGVLLRAHNAVQRLTDFAVDAVKNSGLSVDYPWCKLKDYNEQANVDRSSIAQFFVPLKSIPDPKSPAPTVQPLEALRRDQTHQVVVSSSTSTLPGQASIRKGMGGPTTTLEPQTTIDAEAEAQLSEPDGSVHATLIEHAIDEDLEAVAVTSKLLKADEIRPSAPERESPTRQARGGAFGRSGCKVAGVSGPVETKEQLLNSERTFSSTPLSPVSKSDLRWCADAFDLDSIFREVRAALKEIDN